MNNTNEPFTGSAAAIMFLLTLAVFLVIGIGLLTHSATVVFITIALIFCAGVGLGVVERSGRRR